MERSQAIARLKQHETELKRLGGEHLYLFGSTVRGEAPEDSDVDLFFDHPEGSLGLFGRSVARSWRFRKPAMSHP